MGATRETWTGASRASTVIKTQIPANEDRYETIKTEVEAGRDGYGSLLLKNQAQDAAILAAAGGTSILISSADTQNGFLYDKIISSDGSIEKAINTPGGIEKLDLTIKPDGIDTTSSAVNVTLTSASGKVQKLSFTAADKFVILPDATTLLEGMDVFLFVNEGNFRYGIKDSAGTFICSIDTHGVGRLSLIDNSTAAGTWKATDGADLLMNRLQTVINSQAVLNCKFCKMTSTTVLAAYTGADDDGFCVMLEWDGVTPEIDVVSNELEFDTGAAEFISITRISDTVAAITYSGVDDDGFIVAITYNGTDTLTLGTPYEFQTDGAIYCFCAAITSALVFVGYYAITAQDVCGQVLNWTGSVFTSNTAETSLFNGSGPSYPKFSLSSGSVSAAKLVLSYQKDTTNQEFKTIAWDSTTLTPSSAYAYNQMDSSVQSIVALSDDYFVWAHTSDVGYLSVSLFKTSGGVASLKKIDLSTTLDVHALEIAVLDSDTVAVIAQGIYETKNQLFLVKAVGAASAKDSVLKVISEIDIFHGSHSSGSTQSYPNIVALDSQGLICGYTDFENSNYLTAQRIEVG